MDNLKELEYFELIQINGGAPKKSGWYYLSYLASRADHYLGELFFSDPYFDSSWDQYVANN
jgi:hypothetical protein